MTVRPCSRRQDVLDLLARGQWPQACLPDLRAHLTDCRACSELLLITHAFQQSRATALAEPQLPAPGALWWRAQLCRRNGAVERIGKPIFGAYCFAFCVTAIAAACFAVVQGRHVYRWLDWSGESHFNAVYAQILNASTLFSSSWGVAALIGGLATVALLGGAVVYLATNREM